jgi:hypothetical protein
LPSQAVPEVNSSSPRLTRPHAEALPGVAQEIINVLVATKKHDILILTRRVSTRCRFSRRCAKTTVQDLPVVKKDPSIAHVKTSYDVNELVEILAGVHTLLSFISPYSDQDGAFTVQKNLIDASIQARVQRFAPSEWAS